MEWLKNIKYSEEHNSIAQIIEFTDELSVAIIYSAKGVLITTELVSWVD